MAAGPLAGIQACVFDAYGTLFDVHAAAARCRDALGPKADALSALWRIKQLEYTWLRSLMGRHAPFWQVTGEALDHAMAAHGIEDATLRERLMRLYRDLDAYPDAAPVLDALRSRRMKTAILSNGSPDMLEAAVRASGLGSRLDAVISVEEVGIYKPHPTVYALVEQRLDIAPGRICFVSSNGWDAFGAAQFGFRAVWANRNRLTRDRLPAELSAEIGSLSELPALLA